MKPNAVLLLAVLSTGCASLPESSESTTACTPGDVQLLATSVAHVSSGIRSILESAAELTRIPGQLTSHLTEADQHSR